MAQHRRQLPDEVTPEAIFIAWAELLAAALEKGCARAVAGEAGEPQDEQMCQLWSPFTEAERWLTGIDPPDCCSFRPPPSTWRDRPPATIDGQPVAHLGSRALPGTAPAVPPGTVIDRDGDGVVVRTADGIVEVTLGI